MYQLILISFVIIQTGAINYSDIVDYCKLSCRTPFGIDKHTVCERSREKCGPHQRCRDFKVFPMTDALKQVIVDMHNQFRNNVALGQEGPQPSAANMNVLRWNDELAYIAQCWANTCIFNHDKCRKTEHFKVGQNMGTHKQDWSLDLEDVELIIKKLIQSWYDEVADFNPDTVQYYEGEPGYLNKYIGHYTQMVWGQIQYVGCAAVSYTDGIWYVINLICNYGGSATLSNLPGAEVYKIGEPCSECPSGTTCNEKYKGLCGIEHNPVETHDETDY